MGKARRFQMILLKQAIVPFIDAEQCHEKPSHYSQNVPYDFFVKTNKYP
jgi:hypothetical protein